MNRIREKFHIITSSPKKTKKPLSKKESNVKKQEWASFVCKENWRES